MNNWIDDFVELTAGVNSPKIFRLWGAIFAVGAALERKVWVNTFNSNLFPNLYTVFVAPPGVGKTEITWRVSDVLNSLDSHKAASSSVTKASLMDELSEASRAIARPLQDPPVVRFNSLTICSNELGVLLPSYDSEFMNALTDLYDCKTYSERRRHGKSEPIKIPAPQINLLAACTPSYLQATLPEGAWDQGFLSRVILVYSGDRTVRDLFATTTPNTAAYDAHKKLLGRCDDMYGKMSFTPDAAAAISNWHMAGGPPAPEHPKLQYYNVRRTVHALKLSMIASASRDKELVITVDDVERAINWLLEVELYMPDIFKSMTTGGTAALIEEAWHFVYKQYMTNGKEPVLESRVIHWLSMKAPSHQALQILDLMERGALLVKTLTKKGNGYTPKRAEK